ncbi:DNA repair protein XRCC3-like isoform X1 [Schistocerca serialis cubense]|uniref:DNA repair protein XRCC3-like isoform X1 n=1 Tax=Schistocerca serialis cubense TaxID=2023355 RepID=UPI00214E02E2|nr:DNA repair protein XRCC3-like isoform X1 [Schistocerca serialis cubense]
MTTETWLQRLPEKVAASLEKSGLNEPSAVLLCPEVQLHRLANVQATDCRYVLSEAARSVASVVFRSVESALNNNHYYLSVGCKILDDFLRGGIKVCGITEVAGESSCGKTQLCLQLALTVQYPLSIGGLRAGAVFICTEDVFPHQRLQQLITTFPMSWNRGKLMREKINFGDNIFIEHIADVEVLKQCVATRLPRLLSERNVKLIVVDSIAGVFRNYEHGDALSRAKDLRNVGGKLHALAEQYKAAVVCVNQVTAGVGNDEQNSVPALGLAWANMVTTRLQMFRNRQTGIRNIRVIFSPFLQQSCSKFTVTASGISGVSP